MSTVYNFKHYDKKISEIPENFQKETNEQLKQLR